MVERRVLVPFKDHGVRTSALYYVNVDKTADLTNVGDRFGDWYPGVSVSVNEQNTADSLRFLYVIEGIKLILWRAINLN